MSDLIERLRALSRHEHSDLSIGNEAADELVLAYRRIRALKDYSKAYAKGFAEARERAAQKVTKDNAGAGCAVLRSEIRAMKPDPSE